MGAPPFPGSGAPSGPAADVSDAIPPFAPPRAAPVRPVRQADPLLVLFTLVLAYGSFYLCRANVESAYPLLTKAFGFTKTELGLLSSIPITTYAVGKILMGALGDVIGGKKLLVLATAGSVVATFAFGASATLFAFVVCASVNRFFQSGGWSGAVHVVAQRFDRKRHGLVMGVLSTSYELGNVVSILLCSAIVSAFPGWRMLFVVNPILFAATGVFVAIVLGSFRADRASAVHVSEEAASGPASDPESDPRSDPPFSAILQRLLRQPAFWIAVLLSVLLTFLRVCFLTWTPLYLVEVSRASGAAAISGSIAKSAIFPASGVVAALVVGALSDRFGPGRRAPVMAASLAVVVILVLALAHGGVRSPAGSVILIGGVGLFLLGPYSLLAGALALDASGERGAATAAGIIDGAGYLGASSAGVVVGSIADRWGWAPAFDVVAAAALAATLIATAWSLSLRRTR
jgi:OPA family glycerol-3-phosphate transporter-like MFS transporter